MRYLGVILLLLVAVSASGADPTATKINFKWRERPSANANDSSALTVTAVDGDGKPVPGAKITLKVVRGDAKLYNNATGLKSADTRVDLTTNTEGEAVVGIKTGTAANVSIDAYNTAAPDVVVPPGNDEAITGGVAVSKTPVHDVQFAWSERPNANLTLPTALTIKTLDTDDNAIPGAAVTLKVIRGDATIFEPSAGTGAAAAEVQFVTNSEGEAIVGVKMGKATSVSLNAFDTATDDLVGQNDSDVGEGVDCDTNEDHEKTDCRDKTSITGYFGSVIDTFASSDVQNTFDQGDNNATKTRPVFGLDFSHRLFRTEGNHQLWIYGETVHGTRSAEVKCPNPPDAGSADTSNCTTDQTLALSRRRDTSTDSFVSQLRAATSTEAFFGLRYEPPMSWLEENHTSFYVKGQLGFIKLANVDGNVKENHLGVGIMLNNGHFRDSYVEVGHGRTDLFQEHRTNRWKVDGYLEFDNKFDPATGRQSFITPFLQMTVDAHGGGGKGADAVQIYFGVNMSFDMLNIGVGNDKN